MPRDPGVCWDANGMVRPLGLQELSVEEKDLFVDVNSTLKLPPRQTKDGNHQGAGPQNGRKTSVSHGSTSNYGMSSPSHRLAGPGTRRRETTDLPIHSRAGALHRRQPPGSPREDQSPWFARKGAEAKEPPEDLEEEAVGPRERLLRRVSRRVWHAARPPAPAGRHHLLPSGVLRPAPALAPSAVGAFGSFALPAQATAEKRFGAGRGESRLAHLLPKDADAPAARSSEPATADAGRSRRPRQRDDTDPFGGDEAPSGSALPRGAQDTSPPSMSTSPQHIGSFDTPVKNTSGDYGMSGLSLREGLASPSETNPYRSLAAGEQLSGRRYAR